MNRRSLLLGAGALLVGEPVRRAYSFLQDNPLAVDPRERVLALIRAEVKRYLRARLAEPLYPSRAELAIGAFNALADFGVVTRVTVSSALHEADRLVVKVQTVPDQFNILLAPITKHALR